MNKWYVVIALVTDNGLRGLMGQTIQQNLVHEF